MMSALFRALMMKRLISWEQRDDQLLGHEGGTIDHLPLRH